MYLVKQQNLKAGVAEPDMSQDIATTKFDLDTDASAYESFHIWVKLRKEKEGGYAVSLELGEHGEKDK
jgi:hypothetical protein